ncbi:MAG: hypothetical protein R2764_02835 [Bacteroidales bacterium]
MVVSSNFVDCLRWDPMAGTVAGPDNANIDLIFNAIDLDLGDYLPMSLLTANDPVNSQLVVPWPLHVAEGIL